MTKAQREDLLIEWELTSSRDKIAIREDYARQYGGFISEGHWESYLIEVLNLRHTPCSQK